MLRDLWLMIRDYMALDEDESSEAELSPVRPDGKCGFTQEEIEAAPPVEEEDPAEVGDDE